MNKQNSDRLREQADSCECVCVGVQMGVSGGIQQKRKKDKNLIDRENSVVTAGRRGVEEGTGIINGDGQRLDLGWLTHNTGYRLVLYQPVFPS